MSIDKFLHLPQMFQRACDQGKSATALTSWDSKSSRWKNETWDEYHTQVGTFARWLVSQGVKKGDRVALLSANRPEWMISDLAILSVGAVSVPIYATSSEGDVSYILKHSEAKWIIVDHAERAKMVKAPVERVILFDKDQSGSPYVNCSTIAEVSQGQECPETLPIVECADSDLATIVYTSGTTGKPKGVVHSHGNIKAAAECVFEVIKHPTGEKDRYFSFLPLSHVAERVLVEIGSVITANQVCFARSVAHLAEDLQTHRPTVLLCVPRLWEKIYEKIQAGLVNASPVKKIVFKFAECLGSTRVAGQFGRVSENLSLRARIADKLVGVTLRKRLGLECVRLAVTGSAPTREVVMKFFTSFGIFIREVYGLTENLCLGSYNVAHKVNYKSCGVAFPGNQIKVADDGEILFKAEWMFEEYYKNPEATAEVMEDGWFKTGDLGTLDDAGYLYITGRKKELLKTSNGKYVAPVPIEDELKGLPVIADAMVIGDNQKYCIALISLEESLVNETTEQDIRNHVEEMNQNVAHHEAVQRIGIMKDHFSVEAGTLTPTLKLKRKVAYNLYQSFIDKVYATSDSFLVRE